MATLRQIRNRIRGVRKTQKITRAMKVVAATRLGRVQKRLFASRPWVDRIKELLTNVMEVAEDVVIQDTPLLRKEEKGPINSVLIVITSDRGLCGAFNSNTNRFALDFIESKAEGEVKLVVVGLKGKRYFEGLGLNIILQYPLVGTLGLDEIAKEIATKVIELFIAEEIDQAYILYNEFRTFLAGKITLEKVLPIEPPRKRAIGKIDYLYEPNFKEVIESLIASTFKGVVYRALLESQTTEEAARMMAMDYATENAEEIIADLTLSYHRKRQEAITREMIEIVSGAEALKGAV